MKHIWSIALVAVALARPAMADETNTIASSTIQMAASQTIPCEFTATVISVTEMTNAPLRKGYVIHANAHWQLVLHVGPHSDKTPFQPGTRECSISSAEDVFGVPAAKVKGQYRFTYTWNIDVPGKPEFEKFKATKPREQNTPSDRTR